MAVEFLYPSAFLLKEIEQDLIPQLQAEDKTLFGDILKVENADTDQLEWEQMDNYQGLQQPRGLNGNPLPVVRTGARAFATEPGYYGEFEMVEEKELTRRRPYGQLTGTIDVRDLTGQMQLKLLQRRTDRQRWNAWQLLTSGRLLVSKRTGGYEHRASYNFTTLTASPAFSNPATATPLAFFRTLKLQGRGTSSKFGREAKVYMNAVTINRILNNTNANDIGGRFRITNTGVLAGQVSLEDVNAIFLGNDLPQIVEYDEGYLSDGTDGYTRGQFVPFIPDGYGVAIGKRPNNRPVMYYRMTRNANNADLGPGPYMFVVDSLQTGKPVPRRLEVHDGHNGGIAVEFASAVKILNVG